MKLHYILSSTLTSISIILLYQPGAKAICSNNQVDAIAEKVTVLIDSSKPGSGVIIQHQGNTYTVLTAYHVVKDRNLKYEVVTPDKQRYQLNYQTVKRLANHIDLAIVQFNSNSNYLKAKIGNSDLIKRRSKVYVAGFPVKTAGVRVSIYDCRNGEVIANTSQESPGDGYTLIYDNPTLPGMSGGGVLNSQGEVIGIHGQGEAAKNVEFDRINPSIGTVKSGRNAGIPSRIFLPLLARMGVDVELSTSRIELPGNPTIDRLNELLVQGNWQEADEETKWLMLRMSQTNGVLNEQGISRLSCSNLSQINHSWMTNSQGRFGFSVQARTWKNLFGNKFESTNKYFESFATEVGWRYRGRFLSSSQTNYSLNAPVGHLPRSFLDGPIWGRFIAYLDTCKI
ncbi:hypothetical protein CLI64_24605 [Nostoc sp. CENA543]|uniref:GUN4 domain-containing protein n=1 Tax=Nostoc sp. CENA543 TaxID=1869241 RepID=UPI000CA0E28D|nr:GUN4 domain-containing protein [Nostoc sp. CENA543]AUT03340.1 hypothetical protein CLI64_24605 [Nostoc sp. CENA543]